MTDHSGDDTTHDIDLRQIRGAIQRDAVYLVVVSGSSAVGRMFRLREGDMVLGRGVEVDIQLDDDGVSRKHARVSLKNGEVDIEDLSSRNGTWFAGARIERHRLHDGDKVQLGGTTILRLSYHDALDEALQRNLYESATIDALTGVLNKKALIDALDRELKYALRHREPLSVVMIDVDHFKRINDAHGHLAGDDVLRSVARALQRTLRGEDVLARYGGEEFAVLLRGTQPPEALVCGERLRAAVAESQVEYEGQMLKVTVSVGVATTSVGDAELLPEALLSRADGCLYRAKQAGRNLVRGPESAPSE
ncbi:MAG: GGDEF domain-containing protein [Archangium sp.]|nr:GGDEF domain-containing protein [Archangium sp.]